MEIANVKKLQRIVNDPDHAVTDMLSGFLKANARLVAPTGRPNAVKAARAPVKGKVGVVTGGGSGHKPAFIGYVGPGLCDAAAVGEIFSSPPASAFLEAFRAANGGEGVACLYGNYAGDNMNVAMAIEQAEDEGIEVKTVVANDDVASAPADQGGKRRGVAGEVLMWKIGGAKAELGGKLDDVIAVAQKAIDKTGSIGVGLTPCTIPAVGHPNFEIENGKMELGIGHHGEPGIEVADLVSANEIADRMLEPIMADMDLAAGDEVVALVSGLGATPLMELYILYDRIEAALSDRSIAVYRPYVGNFFTSLEMSGATLSLMKLDDELKECIDRPCDSMGLTQF